MPPPPKRRRPVLSSLPPRALWAVVVGTTALTFAGGQIARALA